MGQFRAFDERLSSMQPGEWINLLKVIVSGSLPNVQSARLYRTINGFNVSINHEDDIFERHHVGPEMTKDDLVEYLTQIKEEIVRIEENRTRGEDVENITQVKVITAGSRGKVGW